jgi:hypothetical protein
VRVGRLAPGVQGDRQVHPQRGFGTGGGSGLDAVERGRQVADGFGGSQSCQAVAAPSGEVGGVEHEVGQVGICVSGVRVGDIDRANWIWTVRRQTTPGPGGLLDKGTKGKRSRKVPLIPEVRDLVAGRLDAVGPDPTARLFTGPRGGRITTAVLRDATHWDEVVTKLGHEHLRRHDLRHTGLMWLADAGVPVHVLRKIAGHGSLTSSQRYLHPTARQSWTPRLH